MTREGFRWYCAIRYLWGKERDGGRYLRGAGISIAISMIPIIVTLIVSDGMIQGITDRFLELGTGHVQIYPYIRAEEGENDPIKAFLSQKNGAERSSAEPLITGYWREVQSLGILVGPKGKSGAQLRAVSEPFLENQGSKRYLTLVAGELSFKGTGECLLGSTIAGTIGATVGSTVRLMTLRTGADGSLIPRVTSLTVRGIVQAGYRELDELWCFVPLSLESRIVTPENSRTFYMIKTENPYGNLEVLVQDLQEYLGSGYGVYSWKELLATQYASFKATQQLLLFIMTLIMIVASFHVTAATTMLVIDKNREIAILKASGAGPKDIEGIFIRSALITVMMGALVGIAIGLGIGYTINEILQGVEIVINTVRGFFHGEPLHLLNPSYYLVEIPVIIRWPMVLGIYGAAVLIGTLAGWGPARRAGAISPVAILQKQ